MRRCKSIFELFLVLKSMECSCCCCCCCCCCSCSCCSCSCCSCCSCCCYRCRCYCCCAADAVAVAIVGITLQLLLLSLLPPSLSPPLSPAVLIRRIPFVQSSVRVSDAGITGTTDNAPAYTSRNEQPYRRRDTAQNPSRALAHLKVYSASKRVVIYSTAQCNVVPALLRADRTRVGHASCIVHPSRLPVARRGVPARLSGPERADVARGDDTSINPPQPV